MVAALQLSCGNSRKLVQLLFPREGQSSRSAPRSLPEASSGRDAGAGEGTRIPGGLERDGRGCGGSLGATQVPVVQLPQQLLVLHGESLVDL